MFFKSGNPESQVIIKKIVCYVESVNQVYTFSRPQRPDPYRPSGHLPFPYAAQEFYNGLSVEHSDFYIFGDPRTKVFNRNPDLYCFINVNLPVPV